MSQTEWTEKKCAPCEGGTSPMEESEVKEKLQDIEGWEWNDGIIERTFKFKNYYRTISFVNAVAWIAHAEDHHPDMEVGYNKCRVCFATHSIGGISENDLICAAKVNQLFD